MPRACVGDARHRERPFRAHGGPIDARQVVKAAGLLKRPWRTPCVRTSTFGDSALPDGKVYGPTTVGYDLPHAGLYQSMVDEFRSIAGCRARRQSRKTMHLPRRRGSIYDAIDEAHEFAGVDSGKKTPLNALCRRQAWLQRNVGSMGRALSQRVIVYGAPMRSRTRRTNMQRHQSANLRRRVYASGANVEPFSASHAKAV